VLLAKITYLKLTENTACMRILDSFGIKFEEGKEFSFNRLIGKKAIAIVEDYKYLNQEKELVGSIITKFKKYEPEKLVN
jgi:hypothetical protein